MTRSGISKRKEAAGRAGSEPTRMPARMWKGKPALLFTPVTAPLLSQTPLLQLEGRQHPSKKTTKSPSAEKVSSIENRAYYIPRERRSIWKM